MDIYQIYPQELFNSSKNVLGCIPSPKFRVIHRSLLFEAIQEKKRSLLNEILEALTAIEVPKTKENTSGEAKEETNDDEVKLTIIEKEETDSENVSNIVNALQKLEEVHREQNENLRKANENLKSSGVSKVVKMQEKIQRVKENLGEKEKTELHLLDQPNSQGKNFDARYNRDGR